MSGEQCTLAEGRCIINPTSADPAVHRPLLPVFAHFEWPVGWLHRYPRYSVGREYIDFSVDGRGGLAGLARCFHPPTRLSLLPPLIDCIENLARDFALLPDRLLDYARRSSSKLPRRTYFNAVLRCLRFAFLSSSLSLSLFPSHLRSRDRLVTSRRNWNRRAREVFFGKRNRDRCTRGTRWKE